MSLEDLEPETRRKLELGLQLCLMRAYDVRIHLPVFRTFDQQDALYAQGRTTPGAIVTNARGGQSFHNVRRAVDFGVYVNGVLSEDPDVYRQVGEVFEQAGLEWGGRWIGFKDEDHLQNRVCGRCAGAHLHATDFLEDGSCRFAA